MEKIIPFKKEILFKTRISKITDISVEHDYKIMQDMIEGEFILSGSYKMTEASVISEDFFYQIPFMVAIGEDVKKESIELRINDFNYEIINGDVLKLDISLLLNCEEETEENEEIIEQKEEEEIMDIIDEVSEKEMDREIDKDENLESAEETDKSEEKKIIPQEEVIEEKVINQKEVEEEVVEKDLNSVIDSVKEKNEYVTYKVYIAKEEDNLESISMKFGISEDILRGYNEKEVNYGDKIIIPYIFDEK